MKVRIITDSTSAAISPASELLAIVPMTVSFGNEEFIDGVTISREEFYIKMAQSEVLPRTSQATPAAYGEVFRQVAQTGAPAVVITPSAHLSGTYQSAVIAASEFENFYVVDSGSVAIGAGVLTARALQLADSGLDAPAIVEILNEEKGKIHMVALLNTLDNLQRSGRISKTLAFAGNLLDIKPMVAVRDDKIVMAGKARGHNQGMKLILKHINRMGGIDFSRPILLGYTGLSDELLQRFLSFSEDVWSELSELPPITSVGGTIGTHAGPDAIAVAFFKK